MSQTPPPALERLLWNSFTEAEAILEAKQIATKENLNFVCVCFNPQDDGAVQWTQEPDRYIATITWDKVRPRWKARYAPRAAL